MREAQRSRADAGRSAEGDDFVLISPGSLISKRPSASAITGIRLFSATSSAEGQCRGQEMLGERILFKRIDGKVYAIEDRCAHRGVQLSMRPECHTKNTISCWYHGFTYDLRDGRLVAIVTDPDSPLIGTISVKSYPIEERKGLVFVFIGDDKPHALGARPAARLPRRRSRDLCRMASTRSSRATGASPPRTASMPRISTSIAIPASSTPDASNCRWRVIFMTREGMVIDQEGAPKGVVKGAGRETSVWETEIEGVKVESQYRPGADAPTRATSPTPRCGCPAASRSIPSRSTTCAQFEWYVPLRRAFAPLHRDLGPAREKRSGGGSVRARDGRACGRTWSSTSSTTRT